jgi:hypothetical protein
MGLRIIVASATQFYDAFEAVFADSPYTAFVSHYTVVELRHMKRLWLTRDGKVGLAIKDHGDGRIEGTALFSRVPHAGMTLLRASVKLDGVNYVECYGPHLNRRYHDELGFQVVTEDPFSREYAAPNWDYKRFGTPNYYTMKLPALRAVREARGRTGKMRVGDVIEIDDTPTAFDKDFERRPEYYKAKWEREAREQGTLGGMTQEQLDNLWDASMAVMGGPTCAEMRAKSTRMAAEPGKRARYYAGEVEHHLKDGRVLRFKPSGPMIHVGRREAEEDAVDFGVGFAARIFVGLNVGDTPTYTIEQVVQATKELRRAQGALPDASFIAQKGLYTDPGGRLVEENSAQIIIIDVQGLPQEQFTAQIVDLAEGLRDRFKQDSVIVEIQEAGIAQRVLGVAAKK